QLTRRDDVTPALEPSSFCLPQSARDQALTSWKLHERKRFAARLVRYYQSRKDRMNAFVSQLFANPEAARAEFLLLYRNADRTFDYAAIDDLLCVLRDRQKHVSASLVRALNEREQYYRSRVLYVDDWMKTSQFLDRPVLLDEFRRFLSGRRHFVMHLHAPGGAGKTAFLQWLV